MRSGPCTLGRDRCTCTYAQDDCVPSSVSGNDLPSDPRAQDLTYCYLHMTRHDIEVLDTIGTPDYLNGDLCIDGTQYAVTWLLS